MHVRAISNLYHIAGRQWANCVKMGYQAGDWAFAIELPCVLVGLKCIDSQLTQLLNHLVFVWLTRLPVQMS